MPRYALKIEYDGAPFCGWQRQKDLPTVQGAVEHALTKIAPTEISITAAGRTDTGVHALGQVAHCDFDRDWAPEKLQGALNYHLKPAPVSIVDAVRAKDDFHARFSARERHYLFRLQARRSPLTHDLGLVWHVHHRLDCGAMQEAADHLIGQHDFTTFRAVHCQANSPIRTMDAITITEQAINHGFEYQFRLCARSFLHNQVRSIVGTLERIGAGSWTSDKMRQALEAKDRAACGPVSPPHGLYLTGVTYPDDPFIDR